MTHQVLPVGGFVLVGGQSQRMGRDKALLELHDQPLVLQLVDLLRPHVAEVTLLGRPERYAHLGLPVLPDRWPSRGPLTALCTGLESSPYAWNVLLACDLPLLEARFLEFLVRRALTGSADAVVPHTAGGWQPLCAAYHRRCLPPMQQALEDCHAGIVDALKTLDTDRVTSDQLAELGFCEQIFKNMNTPEDLRGKNVDHF